MKSVRLLSIAGTGVLVAIPFAGIAGAQAAGSGVVPPHYVVTDLGTLGGSYSYAYGISETGEVAGGAATVNQTDGAQQTGFLWSKGQIANIGTLGGPGSGLSSEAGGPNASGESALISETFLADPAGEDFCAFGTHRQCLAAIWKNGIMTPLPTFGGGNSQAYWVNARGQVAGFAENRHAEPAGQCATPFQRYDFEAAVWQPDGSIQQLSPLPGDTVGFAFGINDQGQAIGTTGACSSVSLPPAAPGGPHAVLWEADGTPTPLPGLGSTMNLPSSINNAGEVVGGSQSDSDGMIHPVLWTKDRQIHDLGLYPGSFLSTAVCCHAINDRGQVVGFAISGDGSQVPLLWLPDPTRQSPSGYQARVMFDLNTLIPGNSPWLLLATASINNAGQIVGYGLINGGVHAFLATPCNASAVNAACAQATWRAAGAANGHAAASSALKAHRLFRP